MNREDVRSRQVRIGQVLFSQGFGTRRECAALCRAGRVAIGGHRFADADEVVSATGLVFEVDGVAWPYRVPALVMLNKPAGYECSADPRQHPSVLALLPAPLRRRGVQPVGRLDVDTTGLLLLTDDGALLHRLTSPRRHVAKVYDVTTKHPVDAAQIAALRSGVLLHGEHTPSAAREVEATGPNTLTLTLTEGKYHQARRMVAAAGNRVEALHRRAVGACTLPPTLASGAWDWVDVQMFASP